MKIKNLFLVALAIIITALLYPASGQAITVSPPTIELDANKGELIQQSIKVRNEEDVPVSYYLTAERFTFGGESGQPAFVGEDVGLATWIKFPYDSIAIPAGETIEVPFTIDVPNFADPGGHYAAVMFSTQPPAGQSGGSQVSISHRIVTLVLVNIAGEVKENAEIEQFMTSSDTYNSLPVDFVVRVDNNGNVHIKPMGSIFIKNMIGSMVAQIPVNTNGGNVLPGQTRKFDQEDGAIWIKNKNEVGATTFWGKYRQQKENFAFGKYTAVLDLGYGKANKHLTSQTTFWVIPWHVIIVNSIIILIIVVILYLLVKKYNSWLIAKYSKAPKKSKSKK